MSFGDISNPATRLYNGYFNQRDDQRALDYLHSTPEAVLAVTIFHQVCGQRPSRLHRRRLNYLKTEQAMWNACTHGALNVAKVVHSLGVPVYITTQQGNATLAHYAAKDGRGDWLRWLADNKAPMDLPMTTNGQTPLHFACLYNQIGAAIFLSEHGANVNRPDTTQLKQRPLHLAAARPANVDQDDRLATRLVTLMVKSGADPKGKNSKNESVLDYLSKEAPKQAFLAISDEAQATYLRVVPRDVRKIIFGLLSAADLTRVSATCRDWRNLAVQYLVSNLGQNKERR